MPDLSKLARSTEDAITEAGLWADDARVSEYARLAKVWPGCDPDALPVPGVVVVCVERRDDWRPVLDDLLLAAVEAAHRSARDRPPSHAERPANGWDGGTGQTVTNRPLVAR
jgi:hypothetical protein